MVTTQIEEGSTKSTCKTTSQDQFTTLTVEKKEENLYESS